MPKKYTFETYEADGQWYWRCCHKNGNVICDGAEGYSSKAKANRSLQNLIQAVVDGNTAIKPDLKKAKE